MKKIASLTLALLACLLFVQPARAVDLVITAASVAYVSGPTPVVAQAGTTITAGQPVYYDASSNTYKLCKAVTAGTYPPAGIALSGASTNGFFLLAKPGTVINIGATVVKNTPYYISGANAGGIAPAADITTGWETVLVIYAQTTANVLILSIDTGIAN